jgi:hypothetical protein
MNRFLAPAMCLCVLLTASPLCAQDSTRTKKPEGQLHGNFQILWQQYNRDSLIGAVVPPPKSAMNAFGNFIYTQGNFSAGVRFESYQDAILGYSPTGRFKGSGIGNRFAKYSNKGLDITVGNFYDQFGSGLIFRSYWEPNLGIDNAMDGVHVQYVPATGVQLKALYGQQRLAFDSRLINADAIVRGLDGEIMINDLIPSLREKKTKVLIGASFVSRFQTGELLEKPNSDSSSILVQLPQNVGSYGGRMQINRGPLTLVGEYVQKINDPSADNNYIFRTGRAILLNASYSVKGLGINVGAKSVDDMSFRSDRDLKLFDTPINFVPALTKQHTYNLAATLYPYATPFTGEASYMAELFYTFKKGSPLGGKYGTFIALNYAAANSLDTTRLAGNEGLTRGYRINSFGFGPTKYVRDFNVEIKKKISKSFSMALNYFYFEFNTKVTPVTNDFKGIVYAHIQVVELNYKWKSKHNIHLELQGLQTDQDKGDWATLVAEYTYSPHWTVGVVNQYNYGNPIDERQLNYLFGTVGYINGANRITLGYGRRRAGVFCIGGVCRAVPATNGFELTITSSF